MIKRQIDFVESIEEIGIEVWNNLAGTDNPFTRYEFLHALESSGSTTAATGWQPFHVLVTESDTEIEIYDQPIAVMPLYLKSNSWGEYVFDWSWAEAYARHGIDYYPKFVTSIPFTPSCGNRILTQEGIDYTSVARFIYAKIREKAESLNPWDCVYYKMITYSSSYIDMLDREAKQSLLESQLLYVFV